MLFKKFVNYFIHIYNKWDEESGSGNYQLIFELVYFGFSNQSKLYIFIENLCPNPEVKMKKLLLPLFAIILCSGMLFADGTQPPGSGTSGDKYQVSTLDHLLWISTNTASWGSYFEQTANIDAAATSTWNEGEGFSPIGTVATHFTGSYNGGNHTISNLFIDRPFNMFIGLFGYTNGASISNLVLVGVNISGDTFVGSLVGQSETSTVNNCSGSGSVTSTDCCGGLVGYAYSSSSIQNCYSSATVHAEWNAAGGIVGSNSSSSVDRCYCTGAVSGGADEYGNNGGLVGYSDGCTYRNCYSRSAVTRTGGWATTFGAFCGSGDGDTFEYCYATGSVICGAETNKGFIGYVSSGCSYTANFFDSQATGQTTGTGATAKTTAQMKNHTTFTDAGWDFEMEASNGVNDYWDMDYSQAINDGYPYLSWQDGGDVSLPVELTGFSARCTGQAVVLEWATESETDNLGFILERAEGASAAWQVIASYQTEAALSSRGNSSSRNEYSFTDNTTQAGTRYSYRLSDVNKNGDITVLSSLSINVAALPLTTTLAKAYSNPFNPRTLIAYELAADGEVSLTVYDMLGRKVRELQTGHKPAGSYQVTWNGADDNGVPLASGSYLVRLLTQDTEQVQKVMLIK